MTLRRYEVTAQYVAAIEAVGFGDLAVEDLVRLKRYEVEPDFIRRLQAAGFEDLTVEKIQVLEVSTQIKDPDEQIVQSGCGKLGLHAKSGTAAQRGAFAPDSQPAIL